MLTPRAEEYPSPNLHPSGSPRCPRELEKSDVNRCRAYNVGNVGNVGTYRSLFTFIMRTNNAASARELWNYRKWNYFFTICH